VQAARARDKIDIEVKNPTRFMGATFLADSIRTTSFEIACDSDGVEGRLRNLPSVECDSGRTDGLLDPPGDVGTSCTGLGRAAFIYT